MNQIIAWDQAFFKAINTGTANWYFDLIMPFARTAVNWVPFYVFIGIFLVYNFRLKGLYVILMAAVCVLITDQLSAHLLKPLVGRLRPCTDPHFHDQVRLMLSSCGGKFSFPSSHAANHFGIAVLLINLLPRYITWKKPVFYIWASLICYAQVYVGVHYPIDVICGALLGAFTGYYLARFFKMILKTDLETEKA